MRDAAPVDLLGGLIVGSVPGGGSVYLVGLCGGEQRFGFDTASGAQFLAQAVERETKEAGLRHTGFSRCPAQPLGLVAVDAGRLRVNFVLGIASLLDWNNPIGLALVPAAAGRSSAQQRVGCGRTSLGDTRSNSGLGSTETANPAQPWGHPG